MIEFNEDGSIKLPDNLQKAKYMKDNRMNIGKCITVKREIVYTRPPKKCRLSIQLSKAITDNRFIENIYNYFRQHAETPMKLHKIGYNEFQVEIGTDFKRCSECTALIAKFRSHLDGNLIDDKGSCTFKQREFCYEDYFE